MKRGRKPQCPYCQSSTTVAKGYRQTATLGARALRRCKSCGRKFTVNSRQRPATAPVEATVPESDLPGEERVEGGAVDEM